MKKLTKAQLIQDMAGKMDVTKKEVSDFFDTLYAVVSEQLKEAGEIVLPDMIKLTLKNKPATPEKPGRNPFTGEAITIKAKPASKQVKATALKRLKDEVN